MKHPIILNEMTWQDVTEYLHEKQSIIIPVGMTEQHSTHLPLGTDTMIALWFARWASEQFGIVTAPPTPFGVGLHCDAGFTGTTSCTPESLNRYLGSVMQLWERQGFHDFILMTAHGVPDHLNALRDIPVENCTLIELFDVPLQDILESQDCARHAGEAETSLMMALYPDMVWFDRIQDFSIPFEEFEPYLYNRKRTPIDRSPGCQGYPSRATAAKGHRIVERIKQMIINTIENA